MDLIWPMHDDEVLKIAQFADQLPAKTRLPPAEVISLSHDNFATNQRLAEHDVPVPETAMFDSPEKLESLMKKFGGEVWLRANTGAGGKGAFKTDDFDRARFWVDMHKGWGSFTVAELLPGPGEYSRDMIWKNGELIMGQHETRVMRGNPKFERSVKSRGVQLRDAPPEVNLISDKAVRALMPEPNGLFRIDLRVNTSNVPCVTEVDAGRFSSGGPVNWHRYGYNMAHEVLKLAFDEPVNYPTPVLDPYPKDTVSIGGRNRSQLFLSLSDVEVKERELAARRSQ